MIRASEESDLDRIIEIWLCASIDAHNFISPAYWEEKIEDLRNVYLPASETFVYEDGETVEGFISMMSNHIAAIFVSPERQGQGIGKSLINFAKFLHPVLTLNVYSRNTGSLHFYKKMGFEACGEKMEEDTGEMETFMKLIHA